jgi:hypothetical protein
VFALAALAGLFAWRHGMRPAAPFALAVGAYVTWAALCWRLAPEPAAVPTAHLLGITELGALALLAASLGGRPDFRRAWAAVAAISTVLVFAACLAGLLLAVRGIETPLVGTFGDLVPGGYRRVQAGLWHPNLLASLCLLLLAGVTQEDAPFSARARRWLVALLGVVVLLTFSRTILSFAVATLARRVWGTHHPALARASALVVALVFVSLTLVNLRLDPSRPWEARLVEAPSPRRDAARTSLHTFVAHPGFGIGPGRSPGEHDGHPMDAHLTPLNVAATLGAPGLALFLALPLLAWRSGAREAAPWCALLAVGLDALACDVEEFRHVFVLVGLAAARRSSGP